MISPFEQFREMGFPACQSSDPADEQHSSQEKVAFPSKLPRIYTLCSRYQSQEYTVNPVTMLNYNIKRRLFPKVDKFTAQNLHSQPKYVTHLRKERTTELWSSIPPCGHIILTHPIARCIQVTAKLRTLPDTKKLESLFDS
jgi:hypothetical protein